MAIDLNKKVIVKNLCSWCVGFPRINSQGDVSIAPLGQVSLTADEVIAQCYSNNKLIVGTDGKGSHAKVFIDDKEIRVEVGFEEEGNENIQNIITQDKVKSLFEVKTLNSFKKKFEEVIVTESEKALVVELIKKLNINDYDKIKFVEAYTGLKIEN